MKRVVPILFILIIAISTPVAGRDNTSRHYNNSTQARSATAKAKKNKADEIYESVRQSYSQGKISADSVVSLALYHKVWSHNVAERCLKLAATDGNSRGIMELGVLYTFSPEVADQTADGVNLLQAAADAGYNEANGYLGYYYFNKKDYKKAKTYFDALHHIDKGFEFAALGSMYLEGNGVPEDGAKARENYHRSALLGLPRGMALYASLLGTNNGGTIDYPEAFFWHYIAGDLGDNYSRVMLYRPRGPESPTNGEVGKDAQMALKWIEAVHARKSMKNEPIYKDGFLPGLKAREQAAEKGDDWARFYLGSMNYNGDFLNQNYAQAIRYYEPIAQNGKLPRQLLAVVNERLAQMYRYGKGVKADRDKADLYSHKAAQYGSVPAYKIVENIQ